MVSVVSPDLALGHPRADSHGGHAEGDLAPDQLAAVTQGRHVGSDLPLDQESHDTQDSPVRGDLAENHLPRETHPAPVLGTSLPPAKEEAQTRPWSRAASTGTAAHTACATPGRSGGGANLDPGHTSRDTQGHHAGIDLAADHPQHEAHGKGVGGSPLGSDHHMSDTHEEIVAANMNLLLAAASLDDIERTRIALANRLGAMQRDGLQHTPQYAVQGALLAGLESVEREAAKALAKTLRAHPLGSWVKQTVGVGEKQGARLVAAIGDVYWNHAENRPRRGPAELWAYCGYAPGQKRRRGVQANWNADAKMRAYLIAESCIKQVGSKADAASDATKPIGGSRRPSPYRAMYDRARANWADRPVSDGHKHNHALRVVAKAVLKDLFLAAKAEAEGANS